VEREQVIETLAGLVRVPSVNPVLAPGEGGGEAGVAGWIRDWCAARGIEAWLEEAAPGRPNVVARVGAGAGRTLVLCGHIDTVSTAGMTIDPFAARLDEGRLYGRGSYDMKGGVAAALCALADLAEERIAGTVLGAFVVDEEHASAGAFDFVARHRADACVLTEPSEERLVLAHKGFVWLEIETRGVAAHGSRWDLGRSAVASMGRIIARLDEVDGTVLRQRGHGLTGPASLHCAMVSGGDGWSTYAPQCTLRVERRTVPGERTSDVVAELTDVVRSVEGDAEMRVVMTREPLECDAGAPIARAVSAAAGRVMGRAPETCGVAYWMDAAVFAAAGIPTVNYGPGGEGAHAAVEWVDVDSVVRTAAVLADTARTFCG
jgi:acetylornithine deacetylase